MRWIPAVSRRYPTVTSAGSDTDSTPAEVEHVVSLLRERLYGAICCLATLAVLSRHTNEDTKVATGGLWSASLPADWVAYLGVYRRAPRGRAALRMVHASRQILAAALLPLLVLVAAGIGWLSTATAMWIAMWVLVAELGIITLLAVRRTELPWWQKGLTVAALVGVGVMVVGIKTLAH